MSQKITTIRDVAAAANVSISTVSRILTGTETRIAISDETRARVNLAIEQLQYRPHRGARALRGRGSKMLGLIVRQADDPFFAQLIAAMRDAAQEKDADIVLGYAESDPTEALRLRDILLDLRYCDGLFLLGDLKESPEDESFISKMGNAFPLVSVSRGSLQLAGHCPSISVNNRQGTRLALDYLIGLGHRRIGFIGAGRVGDLDERYQSYQELMQPHFGQTLNSLSPLTTNSLEGGYQAMLSLLGKHPQPTAVFAADDTLAIGALRAAAVSGIRVPDDVSIIGFDDIHIAPYLSPALTTIRQPITAIACAAIDAMFELVRDPLADTGKVHLLEPELIVRESCAPPRY